jgi:CRP-like cAMP-binding protein
MGEGFDVSKFLNMDPLEVLTLSHGRGIFMAKNSGDRLFYNDKGNQVTLICRHEGKKGREVPEGFQALPELNIEEGDFVFRNGENGDSLYYIIEGEFSVQLENRTLYKINPDELYLGRLSFLLGTPRIADVICTKAARLRQISTDEFEGIFTKFPNYGLVLARLLAQRLSILNDNYFSGSEHKSDIDLLPACIDIPNMTNLPCGKLMKNDIPFAEFTAQESVSFPPQTLVFNRNEDSSHLYFILDGELDVRGANDKIVGNLKKQDFFVGEMSFLLNNRRTATVTTRTDSSLLKISRKDFIHIVKNRPYYALLLSTLLAHRLVRILKYYS